MYDVIFFFLSFSRFFLSLLFDRFFANATNHKHGIFAPHIAQLTRIVVDFTLRKNSFHSTFAVHTFAASHLIRLQNALLTKRFHYLLLIITIRM